MNILIFLIILTILIVTHEWGHFIACKKVGIRVETFSLGFGPKLYSWTHDGTEFVISAIPLGGYIKPAGEDQANSEGTADEFTSHPVGHRALVAVMGPVVNFVLAYLCFAAAFMIGLPNSSAVPARVGEVMAGAPAETAGLQTGDLVLRVDNVDIADWGEMQEYILTSGGKELEIVIERDGEVLTKTMTPEEKTQKDIFGKEHKVHLIGIGQAPVENPQELVIERYGPVQALGRGFEELMDITVKTYQALGQMVVGQRSVKEAMGIVGMFYVVKLAVSVHFALLLHICGIISASLAIFNLLPLPVLDGGHLAFLAVEKIRGRPLPPKVEEGIYKVGFSLILLLAVFVFYADFERIGLIDKIKNLWP